MVKNDFKEEDHVFLSLIPKSIALPIARKLKLIGMFLAQLNPDFEKDLKDKGYSYRPYEYMGIGFISHIIISSLLGYMIYLLFISRGRELREATAMGILIGSVIFLLISYLAAKSVKSALLSEAINIDRNLNFALKDMVLSARAGNTLYEALVSVSNADYGVISKAFDLVVRKVNIGKPLKVALEEMISQTRSDYLKKTGWRLINNDETGSNIEVSLKPIIAELETFQKIQIQNYAKELGLWSLLYMMFSVAIPTIGSTILVIISAFSQAGSTIGLFILFIFGCFIFQISLTYLVKSRRPNVQF